MPEQRVKRRVIGVRIGLGFLIFVRGADGLWSDHQWLYTRRLSEASTIETLPVRYGD